MKTETRELLVELTEEERAIRHKQAISSLKRIENKRLEIKETIKDMKLDLTSMEEESLQLINAAHTGKEYREVECTLTPRGNVWEISRNDTGEVIDSRIMDEDERQTSFDQ